MTTAREKISPEAIQRLREFIEHAPSDEDREIWERILRNRRAVLERKIRSAERKQQSAERKQQTVREGIDKLHRDLAEMRHTLEEIKRDWND